MFKPYVPFSANRAPNLVSQIKNQKSSISPSSRQLSSLASCVFKSWASFLIGLGQIETSETQAAQIMKLLYQLGMRGNYFKRDSIFDR